MSIIELLLSLKYNQGSVTAAIIHADIPENKKVYIEILRRFEYLSKNGRKKGLKLKNMLYDICQSPRALWKYLTKKLEKSGLKQSKFVTMARKRL